MARRVAIVPHTHWDREWYAPFQTFRMQLVDLLDDLLPRLEQDPSYRHFMLDGQMAVIDDYLEIRPERAATLRSLVTSGRLTVGPWYALPDEFLVSGETLIRNLELGLARAAELGGAMEVGYLPDMFGHVGQMPQIFQQLGFEHAVVWRGVPESVDRSGFHWSAPDGSTVRAEYLWQGYGNGANTPKTANGLLERMHAFESEHGDRLLGDILWMNGADHTMPSPWLGDVVAKANTMQTEMDLQVMSLREYLDDAPTDDLPSWTGEMRSGARSNLLMGVASNRVDIKQSAARVERKLERMAEPLCALHLPADAWPQALLDRAWLQVIRNSAHDSVCGCSADVVCDAVLHRYAEAEQIADGLIARAAEAVAESLYVEGAVVVNPSSRRRGGLIEVTIPGQGTADGTQLVSQVPSAELVHEVTTRHLAVIVERELDITMGVHNVDIVDHGHSVDVLLHVDPALGRSVVARPVVEQLRTLQGPERPARVSRRQPGTRTVLARVDDISGWGWAAWSHAGQATSPVRADGDHGLTNGKVRLQVDPETGTFSIGELAGLGLLVDDGDAGDSYNWSPAELDAGVREPTDVKVEVLEAGPLRGRIAIERRYWWPVEVDYTGRRSGGRRIDTRTVVELQASEDIVRIEVSLDNRCDDHRLRMHFPLPEATAVSHAECAFDVVERGLTAEGGPTELPMPTFPSRRFVQAGGLTVAHEGLLEYELVDIAGDMASTLAVTLMRSVGWLSRGPMTSRPLPAGPIDPLLGTQMPGPQRFDLAIRVGTDVPHALVEDVFEPLVVAHAWGHGGGPPKGSSLRATGAEVSSLRRHNGGLELRVYNPTDQHRTVRVEGRSGWVVNLRGRALERFEETVDLDPHRIATLRLDEGAS